MDNAPQPTNPKVKIEQLPPRVIAVHTFSGSHDLDSCKRMSRVAYLRPFVFCLGVQ